MLRNVSLILLAGPTLMGIAVFGQGKPDFTGTWELATIVGDGNKIPAGKTFKETQVWVHQEPKLSLKIMRWDESAGYRTLELSFTTDGKKGTVGSRSGPDGEKDPVNGSAHWVGNRLVIEQEMPNAKTAFRVASSVLSRSMRTVRKSCPIRFTGWRAVTSAERRRGTGKRPTGTP